MKKRSDLNNNCGLSSEAVKYAEKEGLEVRFPKDTELLIDIDDRNAYDQFIRAYGMLTQLFPEAKIVRNTPSKSDGQYDPETCVPAFRRHIIVELPEAVDPILRVAYQAILGSDCRRELLTIKNLRDGDLSPTLFFEVKK